MFRVGCGWSMTTRARPILTLTTGTKTWSLKNDYF
nr:MAG TPA: hypothetical protein [Caudoviricetes sp.]